MNIAPLCTENESLKIGLVEKLLLRVGVKEDGAFTVKGRESTSLQSLHITPRLDTLTGTASAPNTSLST